MIKTALYAAWLAAASLACASADSIVFSNGQAIKGTILRYDGVNAVIGLDYGVVRYPVASIKLVNGKPPSPVQATLERAPLSPSTATKSGRFPKWRDVVAALSSQSWASGFRQIPATVVDKGVMRNVPYISFKCGGDYEMNIYGDPDDPASVEIGVRNELLKSEDAKRNCVEFVASLFSEKAEKDILRAMDRRKAILERDRLTYEITPETAEDAYGGWWVSAYSEKALDAARASDAEVATISVPRQTQPSGVTASVYSWSPTELEYSRPPAAIPPIRSPQLNRSGTPAPRLYSTRVPTYTPSSYGRVYVRSYFRKDGTYVSSHTRSR